MKRPSHQRRLRTWLAAILIFVGLNMLLLVSYPNIVIAQKLPQSRQAATTGEKITRATLKIANRCPQPHYFRISSDIKDPRFKQQTDAILVGASSTKKIEVLFDATGSKSSLKAAVECLDCKKKEGCAQDRYEVPIETTAVDRALKTGPPGKPRSISGGPVGVPGPGNGVFSGGLIDVPVPVLGVNYVGIIPERYGACPAGSDRVYIGMDDEDDHSGHPNTSSVTGWTGDISRSSIGTTFGFCRVKGDQFHTSGADYAVLKLSENCPPESVSVDRYFDNENDDNRNWSSGNIAPSNVHVDMALTGYPFDTVMRFCFFRNPNSNPNLAGDGSFPNFHVPYGVFAAPSSASFDTGIVHTDDEDGQDGVVYDHTSSDVPDVVLYSFAEIIYGTEAGTPLGGKNTDLRVTKVANGDCINPCQMGSYDNANCWVGKPPPGTTAIILQTSFGKRFYWTPATGTCPTWYDGATNCYMRAITPSSAKSFVWSNMWYVEPICRP